MPSGARVRPLPVAQPERLVNHEAPGPKPGPAFCNDAGGCDEVFSHPMYRDLQLLLLAGHRGLGVGLVVGSAVGPSFYQRSSEGSGPGAGATSPSRRDLLLPNCASTDRPLPVDGLVAAGLTTARGGLAVTSRRISRHGSDATSGPAVARTW